MPEVLEARRPKIKVLANLVFSNAVFWFMDSHLLTLSLHDKRGEGALWGSLLYGH